jgi:hypothetical protein
MRNILFSGLLVASMMSLTGCSTMGEGASKCGGDKKCAASGKCGGDKKESKKCGSAK